MKYYLQRRDIQGLVKALRQHLRHLTPKLELLCIHGSVANGTFTALSDIDILTVGPKTMKKSFKKH